MGFPRLLLTRVVHVIPVALLVVMLNFVLLKSVPGDLADVIAGEAGGATPEYMAQLRALFGADLPLSTQFIHYIEKIATLDLGWSFRYNEPVFKLITERLPATGLLMGSALSRVRSRAGM